MGLILHPNYELYEKKDKAFCSSLQVAQEFGKEHSHVLRDIRELDCSEEFNKSNFGLIQQTVDLGNGRTRKDPMYLITKDGFMFLVMGYRGKKAATIKEAYIKRFNDMEKFIKEYISTRDEFLPFTQAVQDAHQEPKSYHYSNEINMINRIVLGMDAKRFKEIHGLENVPSIRPYLSDQQAKDIRKLQVADVRLLYTVTEFQERKNILTNLYQQKMISA